MPKVFIPLGSMNLDKGPAEGDHLWVVKDLWLNESGYERVPEWEEVAEVTSTGGTTPRSAFSWPGGGTAARVYYADDDKIREWDGGSTVTDVSGSAYTNETYNGSWAQFGQWCLFGNGVDKLQILEVPSTVAQSNAFSDHDSGTYATISANSAVIAPKYICSHKNHIAAASITMKANYGQLETYTTGAGAAFTNQPTGDAVEILSTSALDTMNATVYGTTQGGGDTVSYENITLNGLGVVTTVKTDWGKILAVKVASAANGTITFREASGNLTITTITAGNTTSGVEAITLAGGGNTVEIVADGATTQQIGITGDSNSSGDIDYDSQTLTGTTALQSNLKFVTVLEVFTGDLEAARTVTITSYEFANGAEYPFLLWISQTDSAINFGDPVYSPSLVGSERIQLFDGEGELSGVVDCGDSFIVFKTGSITRIAGPPWTPSVISYTEGMARGLQPYKQGSRVYFWGSNGLSYVDLLTNQVVSVLNGVAQRGITNYSNYNYDLIIGGFPETRTLTLEIASAFNTNPSATYIMGDRSSGHVLFGFQNLSAGAVNGCIYNERNETLALTVLPHLISGPAAVGVCLPLTNTAPFPFSQCAVIAYSSATKHSLQRTANDQVLGFYNHVGTDSSIRFPFINAKPNEGRIRITKVQPVFSEPNILSSDSAYNIRAEIISISGQGNNWLDDGILTASTDASLDGWIDTSGCPLADRQSIGLSFSSNIIGSVVSVYNFVGVNVEYVAELGRSL